MIAKLTIDLAAIERNARALRALVAPASFAAVVKANAYGHGLLPVAQVARANADLLCVYHAEEALALRAGGIGGPLLVLGPVDTRALSELAEADVAMTLWDTGSYRRAVTAAARASGSPLAIHVKIETGVGRFGLAAEGAPRALSALLDDPGLRVDGVFTHLAAAEELESAFTNAQRERFLAALAPLASTIAARGILRHAAASAAALLYPALRLDMVRCGIALYGLWPSPETRKAYGVPTLLEPALRWTSTLAAVREVEAGRPVGYGCSFQTTRHTRVGIVPIGYAEGIPRAVSNAGAMLVRGTRAPILGRVCMNATLIDVTDIPRARAGSTVTLIGRDGESSLGADDWARWANTINYEIVARLPAEIPRVYTAVTASRGAAEGFETEPFARA